MTLPAGWKKSSLSGDDPAGCVGVRPDLGALCDTMDPDAELADNQLYVDLRPLVHAIKDGQIN